MIDTPPWILVDVGQVLIGFDHAVVSTRLQSECFPAGRQAGAERTAIDRFIFGGPDDASLNRALDRGTKDLDGLRLALQREFGVHVAPEKFEEIWTSIFAPDVNAQVVACVETLRTAGVQVAICSNTNAAHWHFLRRRHQAFREVVDGARCYLSFDMGSGKGDPGFFERIAADTKAPLGSHLLLDDKDDNCRAARAAGMRAVVFDVADPGRSLQETMDALLGGTRDGA